MSAETAAVEDEGARIEALLSELHAMADPSAVARVDELVKRLVDLYGAGLSRIVSLLGDDVRATLARDDLVSALLVLHGLHPDGVAARVEAALERARPYLASHAGGVAFLGVDDHGVARIRLEGTCDGCASRSATVRGLLERAILEGAPEIVRVEIVESETEELVPLRRRP